MKTVFFSDPHLGLPRQANTTPASSAALQQALYDQAMDVVGQVSPGYGPVCLGDVFDRYSNPEQVVKQGHSLVSSCQLVLAGNHDISNRDSSYGSLELIHHLLSEDNESPCVFAEFGKPWCQWLARADTVVVAVPHVATQGLFEESLGLAMDEAVSHDRDHKLLLLHSNYNLPDAFATETALNLKDEHVEELLQVYDYIMIGHQHLPAEHYDGRLIVLGNTHPTGFGDISDKRIAIWEDGKFKFERIWRMADGYAEYHCDEIPRSSTANFVRIKGKAEANAMLGISREVAAMWERSPSLYAVKIELTLPELQGVDGQAVTRSLSQLPDIIRRELESEPKLLALWDKLAREEGGE